MKKEEKLFELLMELINDESRVINNAYLAKVEKAIELYTEIFLKPKLQGKDKLTKIVVDKKPRGADFSSKKSFAVGGTEPATGNIHIYAGLLKDIRPTSPDFFELRNEILMKLFTASAHEVRHSFQVAYRKELERGVKANAEKAALYKNLLGDDAAEIALSTVDRFTNDQLELYINFLKVARPEKYKNAGQVLEAAKESNTPYWASLHEIDARSFEIDETQKLLEFITNNIENSMHAYRFPERFDELINILGGAFSQPQKRRKDPISSLMDTAKNLGKAQKEVKRKTKDVERDFVDMTDQFLKQNNVFVPTLDVMSTMINNEMIIEGEYVAVLDMIIKSMKSVCADDIVAYAKGVQGNPNKEALLTRALGDLTQIKYTRDFVGDNDKMKETAALLEKEKLDWAKDIVEMYMDVFNSDEQSI